MSLEIFADLIHDRYSLAIFYRNDETAITNIESNIILSLRSTAAIVQIIEVWTIGANNCTEISFFTIKDKKMLKFQ